MAISPYPLPRGLRQTSVLSGNGGATYGPFAFGTFDLEDVTVYVRLAGEVWFSPVSAIVTKVSGLPYDFFTVTLPSILLASDRFVVSGQRQAERSAGVRKGSALNPDALEKEFSKIVAAQQELRRDIGRALLVDFGAASQMLPTPEGGSFLGWDQSGKLVNRQDISGSTAIAEAAAAAALAAATGNYVYARRASVQNTVVPLIVTELETIGDATVLDGKGGRYSSTNNGAADTITDLGGRVFYRVQDVGIARLAPTVFSDAAGAVRKTGSTMSSTLFFDNGSSPVIPVVDANGAYNIRISGTSHFKLYADLDGDTDYDADMWSKDNMYIVAEAGIHLRPGYPGGLGADQGRVVFKAENGTNYIQSGRNYSGTTENDLVISKYSSSFAWVMFDVSQNGYGGFGYSLGDTVPARLSAKDAAATIGYLESTSGAIARMAFKGTTTTSMSSVAVGANGDDLELRGSGAAQVRINATGMYPYTDNARICGSASFRWSTFYGGTGAINTSDARAKRWLGPVPDAVLRALKTLMSGVGHFQFLDAIAQKGDAARKHIGVLAQDVIAAFEAEGLDPWEWAPICKDPVYRTVTKSRQATREVTRVVEKTRSVEKKILEEFDEVVERIEMRDGVAILVREVVTSRRAIFDVVPLLHENGDPVVKFDENGLALPVTFDVARTYSAEEVYTVEETVLEIYDEEYEEQEETGEYILGLRAEELMWGIMSVLAASHI